ncbi:glycosyltransferase family 2 protein [uncultured Sphingobacterium sp.]|uniref:glycosyltransferase family 2 protein n=1 Tax=uncultured Sphingobacterium sp. TaxID=182688 RepID=UPI002600B391|nr:glycosyltransferase family 2 protein [uncultured Sphingobacterium sp.]
MRTLISVIVPFYNVEPFLENTLKSLLTQSFANFELVLINDSSSDNSKKIAHQVLSAQSKIDYRIIENDCNMGISFTRNVGIANANGKFIVFVDADDFVAENFIQKLYSPFNDEDIDISVCKFEIVDLKSKTSRMITNEKNAKFQGKIDGKIALQNLLQDKERSFLCKCMFKKELFKNISFPKDCNFMEDTIILPRLYARANAIFFIPFPALYLYKVRASSATTGKVNTKNFVNMPDAIAETVSFVKNTRKDIATKYLTRFQFLCTYNIVYNVLHSANVDFNAAKSLYKNFEKNLIRDQLVNLISQKSIRSLIWLLKLKISPKSVWKRNQ